MTELTHDEISAICARWLKRPISKKGAACHISMTEVGGVLGGEIADVWGYYWGFPERGSVLVEVKVSRSDFLADAKKPHRNGEKLGMGTYRYYACPEGMISVNELPKGWGLLYITKRGWVRPQCGHLMSDYRWPDYAALDDWKHQVNVEHEMQMLAHLIRRYGDVNGLNEMFRRLHREKNTVNEYAAQCKKESAKLSREVWSLKQKLKKLTNEEQNND